MAKSRVFLDSSVIISALLSTTGGSFYILEQFKEKFTFQTSEYGLAEIQAILQTKFARQPELQTRLFLLLGTAQVQILPNPAKRQVNLTKKHISLNDAPILASALKHSDYLLSLDNEFFKLNISTTKKLIISKPKEFINLFR